jgi:peptidoglycan hydrolase-like protein with peptidoglycan-binding domain
MSSFGAGAHGQAVQRVQERLVELGYELEVDGAFGDDTDGAVRAFQEAIGLECDGKVGPETWYALTGNPDGPPKGRVRR